MCVILAELTLFWPKLLSTDTLLVHHEENTLYDIQSGAAKVLQHVF